MNKADFVEQGATLLSNGHYKLWGIEFKECWACKVLLSLETFANKADAKDNLNPICKPCANARTAKWYKEHREYKLTKDKQRRQHRVHLIENGGQ